MELSQLRCFLTAARLEHITRAAEELHLSQPSLSRALANLETELGVPLFERAGRGVHLSPYGQAFARRVAPLLHGLDDAVRELSDLADGEAGELRLASSFPISPPGPLYRFVRQFYFDHPAVTVHQYQLDNAAMTAALVSRELDLALATVPLSDAAIEERPVYAYRLGVAVGPEHPLARAGTIHLRELEPYRILSNNSSPDLRDSVYELCARAGFAPRIGFEGDNAQLIGEAVSRGLGVALISRDRFDYRMAQPDCPDWERSLVYLEVADEFCTRRVYCAWLRGRYLSASASRFREGLLALSGSEG